uniref:Chromosome 7 open reading frame 25 n=1 Tax=Ornithorhynchus anatinus TaxID=9258 RepID=A0A6I8N610_ORNAN
MIYRHIIMNNATSMSVHSMLRERIAVAQELIKRAEALSRSRKGGIEGGAKLCSKLKAELKFLHKVEAGKVAIKESHLQSTNLTHLRAVVESAEKLEEVVSVLHVFGYADGSGEKQTLVVDVVANGGHAWVKAIGRKAEALHNIWLGRGQYGDKSVVEQAEDFLQASRQQPVQYSNPHIVFAFYNGVSSPMAEKLREMGISVRGDIVAVDSPAEDPEEPWPSPRGSDDESPEVLQATRVDREKVVASVAFPTEIKVAVCTRVNLDITTLITYVSALSYGGCYLVFREKVLTEQAAQERKERVLPQLEAFMQGKELFACESAVKDFQSILDTLGGPGERERAAALIGRIQVVPDQPSDRALRLVASSKINSRSLTVFGTGDALKAVTMTANSGFVRAASNQGVKFSVFIHQPRALTESKEALATPLPKNCTTDGEL